MSTTHTEEVKATSRVWTVELSNGHVITGHLPSWAQEDPSAADVPVERVGVHLADIVHDAWFGGVQLPVTQADGPAQPTVMLGAVIECRPYADDPTLRVPVASVQILDDTWLPHLDPDRLTHLDPDRLTQIAARLRAQADLLDHQVRPALTAARTDWHTAHTPADPEGGRGND